MPKRADLQTVLVIGAGPIVIGQASEFDYSGTQACMALKEEGYRVVLINSNPATIMTDPEFSDATYIEPINWQTVEKIIQKERPQGILATMGGQTALNCGLSLARQGVLERYGVELLGVNHQAIELAENRGLFAGVMKELGYEVPQWGVASNVEQALEIANRFGFPVIIRPSFTLGGAGGGIAYNREEFETICQRGFSLSPIQELLIDQSIIGWKEYELEVIRDGVGNGIVICTIENVDPMGIHTGDSITVAPAQTLIDKEYQVLRDAALTILTRIGIQGGGANVQFAVNPENGDWVVVEMNPRVSRSSALASKATGYPIASVAAKLAIGYSLDELKNKITQTMPASFEATIDYVVTKIPRFNFEKFPETNSQLTTQMKSLGEVMGIGRTFQESLQKALRSLEIGVDGLLPKVSPEDPNALRLVENAIQNTPWDRLWYIADAFRLGLSVERVHELCHIDPWFLVQIQDLVNSENAIQGLPLKALEKDQLWRLKRQGFSDSRLATLLEVSEAEVSAHRRQLGVRPVYKRIDSCAGEFDTPTNYLYSSYERFCEARVSNNSNKIIILGGGPNRIGQGIEFDYCCVHAVLSLRQQGYETIMVNCNPETVSTDYHISNRLYFEPVTLEDVMELVHLEKPKGVVVQYGGQTPLKLARALEVAGAPIIGTSPSSIAQAEDREQFQQLVNRLGLRQPPSGIVRSVEEGLRLAKVFAYPLIVRPSYVLGGRAMAILYSEQEFTQYLRRAEGVSSDSPLLMDQFLDNAIEIDVDAVSDGQEVLIAGIMEHIEEAGIHSGDSSCCLPAHALSDSIQQLIREQMTLLARELQVVGLMNAQFALKGEHLYILEVNPRASRTVPFVAKATGIPVAKIAAACMVGNSLKNQGIDHMPTLPYRAVKQPVFPFVKFPEVDPILGPEMRSTGEVMGIGASFGEAFYQSMVAAGHHLPKSGCAFISVRDADKPGAVLVAQKLIELGFQVMATRGTATYLEQAGVVCERVHKVMEGRPHVVDQIKNKAIDLIINTTQGAEAIADSFIIRRSAILQQVCYTTTLSGAHALCAALSVAGQFSVRSLQELYLSTLPSGTP